MRTETGSGGVGVSQQGDRSVDGLKLTAYGKADEYHNHVEDERKVSVCDDQHRLDGVEQPEVPVVRRVRHPVVQVEHVQAVRRAVRAVRVPDGHGGAVQQPRGGHPEQQAGHAGRDERVKDAREPPGPCAAVRALVVVPAERQEPGVGHVHTPPYVVRPVQHDRDLVAGQHVVGLVARVEAERREVVGRSPQPARQEREHGHHERHADGHGRAAGLPAARPGRVRHEDVAQPRETREPPVQRAAATGRRVIGAGHLVTADQRMTPVTPEPPVIRCSQGPYDLSICWTEQRRKLFK